MRAVGVELDQRAAGDVEADGVEIKAAVEFVEGAVEAGVDVRDGRVDHHRQRRARIESEKGVADGFVESVEIERIVEDDEAAVLTSVACRSPRSPTIASRYR